MGIVLEDFLIWQLLMQQIVAIVKILWDFAIELLNMMYWWRVDMTLVQFKMLLKTD
jgi:hypothetical protein